MTTISDNPDPDTFLGMHINDVTLVLDSLGLEYAHTFKDRRKYRWSTDYRYPERYNFQVDENDVVVRARVG